MRWMQRGATPSLYSPGAVPRKEGEDWGADSVGGEQGKKIGAGVRRKKML
jgi:hypothetical protein